MVERGYIVPGANCDGCDRQGLRLYPRFRDGHRWLCRRCIDEKKFMDE